MLRLQPECAWYFIFPGDLKDVQKAREKWVLKSLTTSDNSRTFWTLWRRSQSQPKESADFDIPIIASTLKVTPRADYDQSCGIYVYTDEVIKTNTVQWMKPVEPHSGEFNDWYLPDLLMT